MEINQLKMFNFGKYIPKNNSGLFQQSRFSNLEGTGKIIYWFCKESIILPPMSREKINNSNLT